MMVFRPLLLSLLVGDVASNGNPLARHRQNTRSAKTEASLPAPCLCVFDIDRTLTGKQGDTNCSRNVVTDMYDDGYGGGPATLSALSAAGINTTFCGGCYLGICSAGHGSGEGSEWNNYLLNTIMRSGPQDKFLQEHPTSKRWSYGTKVVSPYVLNQGNKVKQDAVELIRQWYGEEDRNITIQPDDVYFFGDRTENIVPFKEYDLNSREISCASRDPDLYHGSGMVGYCGATPEEIMQVKGNHLCRETSTKTTIPSTMPTGPAPCLCVFDIDRTLTGKQGDTANCTDNIVTDMYDEGYGGGSATLSALSAAGINTTFCGACYLGITSAGRGSGEGTPWNNYILDTIMRSGPQDAFLEAHPAYKRWSYGTDVQSSYVLSQGNKIKQDSVELIRQWYGQADRQIIIQPEDVYFFGDRTENIMPFQEFSLNSREISCDSRDSILYRGSGMVGYCGATLAEIVQVKGNHLCA